MELLETSFVYTLCSHCLFVYIHIYINNHPTVIQLLYLANMASNQTISAQRFTVISNCLDNWDEWIKIIKAKAGSDMI